MPSAAGAGNLMPHRMALLIVVFALAIAIACGGGSDGGISPSCMRFESVSDSTGLISRTEAEELAVGRLSMSAPEVSGTDVERVWASCLTTLRSYERVLLGEGARSNPDLRPPDTPVWVVEVKGISRPAGISAANADNPYRFAMEVHNAENGEFMKGARYQEPRLLPAQEG